MNNKDILKNLPNICGWTPEEQYGSGCIEWAIPGHHKFSIFATPNWNTEGEVPIDVYDHKTDNCRNFAHVRLWGDLERQLKVYKRMIELTIKSLDN